VLRHIGIESRRQIALLRDTKSCRDHPAPFSVQQRFFACAVALKVSINVFGDVKFSNRPVI
jgi:hypothetical protein